ncbi:MAG: VWA domain-containing protein, partial [Candidatus Hodarchaeales archaeon]
KNENPNNADIIIGSYIKGSYVSDRIYINPEYLGSGRVTIHEFGHYVYDLGDEYCDYKWVESEQKYYQIFRFAGKWIKCTEKVEWETNVPFCPQDEDYKVIKADSNGESASIMWCSWPDSIINFCDQTNHNKFVLSHQNQKNNLKSCLGTIEENAKSKGYSFKAVGGITHEYGEPIIIKVKDSNLARIVLVIDRSGSMRGTPLDSAKSAAMKFVQEVDNNNYIGVVQFNDSAQIVHPLTKISFLSRLSIQLAISGITSYGLTSIGAGLLLGKNLLESNTKRGFRNILIVLTDGQENTPPWISQIAPQILSAKIVVFGVAMGDVGTTNKYLRDLCNRSGGTYQAVLDWTGLAQVYNQIQAEVNPKCAILVNKMKTIKGKETIEIETIVDTSISSGLKFSLDSLSIDTLNFTLSDPYGKIYDSSYYGYSPGPGFKVFNIPSSDIKAGTWKITIKNTSNSEVIATVNVKAESSLRVNASVDNQLITFPDPIHIKASAKKEGIVITNLNVIAEILTPLGEIKRIPLKDNGVNGDFMPGDGSYEALFFDYDSDGNYSITVIFKNEKNEATLGPFFVEPPPAELELAKSFELELLGEDFQRQTNTPSVTLSGYTGEEIPPGKIDSLTVEDLKLLGTIIFNQTLIPRYLLSLQWAAPGGSGYIGKASYYEMRYSTTPLTEENFDNGIEVVDLPKPEKAGTFQKIDILDLRPGIYYFAIRAVNESGEAGHISNNVVIELPPVNKK